MTNYLVQMHMSPVVMLVLPTFWYVLLFSNTPGGWRVLLISNTAGGSLYSSHVNTQQIKTSLIYEEVSCSTTDMSHLSRPIAEPLPRTLMEPPSLSSVVFLLSYLSFFLSCPFPFILLSLASITPCMLIPIIPSQSSFQPQ